MAALVMTALMLAWAEDGRGEPLCEVGDVGPMSRREIEGADGSLVELARLLETPSERTLPANDSTFGVSFWDADPTREALDTWMGCEGACEGPEPPGYDELDDVIRELDEVTNFTQDLQEMDPDERLDTRFDWMGWLFDPDWSGDYYDTLELVVTGNPAAQAPPSIGLAGWRTELIDIRDNQLPLCTLKWPKSEQELEVTIIENSPSKINQARKDEFNREFANIRAFLAELTNPQSQFYRDLITTRILPQFTEPLLETHTDVQNLTVSLDTPSLAMVGGILTYTFTYAFDYWNDCGVDCPPPTWVPATHSGQGTVKIPSLKLDGGPTDGMVTYEFTYDLAYDVPRLTPVFEDDGSGDRGACGDGICTPDEYCGAVNQCETDCQEECNPDQGGGPDG